MPSKSHLRRILGRGALVLGLLLALLYLTRGRTLGPLAVRLARGPLEELLGARLEVGRFGGNWLTSLVLEGVQLVPLPPGTAAGRPGTRVALRDGRIELAFGPGLLLGNLEALRLARVEARSLALDLTAGGDDEAASQDGQDEPSGLPERLLPLTLSVDELVVRLDEEQTLAAHDLVLEAQPRALSLQALASWKDSQRSLELPLELSADYGAPGLSAVSLRLGDVLAVDAGRLDPATGAFAADGRLCDGSLAAESDGARLRFELGGTDLARLGPLLALGVTLQGRLEAKGELRLSEAEGDAPGATRAGAPEPADGQPGAPSAQSSPWGQVTLTADALGIDDVRLDRLEASVLAQDGALRAPSLHATLGANELRATDCLLPLEGGDALALLSAARGSLRVSLRDVPLLTGVERDVPEHAVALAGSLDQGTLTLSEGSIETAGGSLGVRRGTLRLASGAGLEEAQLDLELDVAFEELAELARLVGRDDWSGSLLGRLDVRGPLSAPRGQLEASVARLSGLGRELGQGTLRLVLEPERARLEALELAGPSGELSASGSFTFEPAALHELRVEARLPALEALGIEALGAGSAALVLSLDGPPLAPTGSLALDGAALEVAGSAVDELHLALRIDGQRASVEELTLRQGDGRLALAGVLERDDAGALTAVLSRLEATYRAGRLALAAPAAARFEDVRHWRVEPLELSGRGSARLEASRDDDRWHATLVTRAFDPSPLFVVSPLERVRTSGIDATLTLDRDGEELQARYDVSVPELRMDVEDAPWTAILRGGFDGSLLSVESLVLSHERVGTLSATGTLPLDPTADEPLGEGQLALELVADVRLDALARRLSRLSLTSTALEDLSGRARANLRLDGGWRDTHAVLALEADEVALGALDEALAGRSANLSLQLDARERWTLGPTRVEAGTLGTLAATGGLEAPFRAADLVHGRLDALLGSALDLELDLALDDVGWLAHGHTSMRRCSGALRGSLQLHGTPAAPEFEGTLELSDGVVRLASDFPALEALRASLRFDQRSVTLDGLTGELGAEPFRATGSVSLASDPVVELRLEGQNLLFARQSGLRVRADARLHVAGPLSALHTEGTLELTESRYGRDLDFLGALRGEAAPPSTGGRGLQLFLWRDEPLSRMEFDVHIGSKKPLVVKNNVASTEVRPDLQLKGTGEVPLLQGRVYIDPGRLSLPSGTLLVESGLIEFLESAPFRPRIELQGKTRLKGYEIGVRVSGNALRPEIELWSTPPLPSDDLLVLFLSGELPEGSVGNRSERAAETVAVYLAKDYLARWLRGDSEGGNGVLERLEIEVGADVTRSGAPTTEVSYYFSDRPRETGWVPYLNAERDEYDKINLGLGLLFRLR